ncbi:TetR/AcrR family transcriptional regulator [Alloacidobacterium dinghuense]|uniref:TetR/AcrR family transcriptional regulator n=1 Tax=Alloacidobacterium dinghuense TaxID=2763107 RepID=A0A7G8BKV7_9BACT|nr:TetR/AcrR family transcriptional regulator [Alloacidobacterium dinghuense]QNI33177.1 TetR/AcrR family transcriptional regulator [Alloacidobacterium dinghuense]
MSLTSSTKDRADQTRGKILRAAIREFSAHGLAGARTDTIAESAKVNKALIYYYFKSKSGLYEAALEQVSGMVAERTLAVLDPKYSAGERLLRATLNHFDRILTQRDFQSLMQQEMVRFRLGESGSMPLIVKKFFKPLLKKLQETVAEGIRTGELCDLDSLQVVYSMLGANVFYFLSAPMMRLAMSLRPFDKAEIAARRKASVQFLGNALFADRTHGANLAKHVLAAMPVPQAKNVQMWGKLS